MEIDINKIDEYFKFSGLKGSGLTLKLKKMEDEICEMNRLPPPIIAVSNDSTKFKFIINKSEKEKVHIIISILLPFTCM